MNNKTTLHKSTATDSLKFSTFNYFGLGAILPAVSEAFWIKYPTHKSASPPTISIIYSPTMETSFSLSLN